MGIVNKSRTLQFIHVYPCSSVIMFIVNIAERNIYDQRCLEYAVRERNPRIKVIRRTLRDLLHITLAEDKRLVV